MDYKDTSRESPRVEPEHSNTKRNSDYYVDNIMRLLSYRDKEVRVHLKN